MAKDIDLTNERGELDIEKINDAVDAALGKEPEKKPEKKTERKAKAKAPEKKPEKAKEPEKKEKEEEREEEGNGDEHADNNTPAGDDDQDSAAGDDESANADDGEGEDWFTTGDFLDLAESVGLSEDDLRAMGGQEEFERHVQLLDRQFAKHGREALETPTSEKETGKEAKPKGEVVEKPRGENGQYTKTPYKPAVTEDDFDKALVEEFGRLGQHFEGRIEELIQRLEQNATFHREASMRAEDAEFNAAIDGLEMPDLFGTSSEVKRGSKEDKSRREVREACKILIAGSARFGQEVTMTPALVRRAVNMQFADDINKKNISQFSNRLKNQSRKKLGGGTSSKPNKDLPWTGDPRKDPVLLKKFRDMESENG